MVYQQKLWVVAATVGIALGACAPEHNFFQGDARTLCGPCRSLASGDYSVSGNAQLDGFFSAAGALRANTLQAQFDFDTEVLAIAEAFGLQTEGVVVTTEFVAMLNGVIQAEITNHTAAGLAIRYTRPKCEASAEIAAQAQASCEASGECDIEKTPGELALTCQGMCTGQCSGTCTGELACAVEAASASCEGMCEGACTLDVAGTCEGACYGDCDQGCSLSDSEGQCIGSCEGLCTGTCKLQAASSCSGTCTGTCLVDPGSAACTVDASCRGACEGECSGTCEGSFDPPSATVDCEATAECHGQAQAQAQANVTCTAPVIELTYDFKAGLSAEQKSMFLYRLDALKTHAVVALQAGARLVAILTGEVGGQVVFEPAPIVSLTEGIADFDPGDHDLPAGRLPCVIPAFSELAMILEELQVTVVKTVPVQIEFLKIFAS